VVAKSTATGSSGPVKFRTLAGIFGQRRSGAVSEKRRL
jgi:hypothetical protein